MSNCSEHKKEVAGISDMKVLAEMIGDLHYETLTKLLDELSKKFRQDSRKDWKAGKPQLSERLKIISTALKIARIHMGEIWQISKPFMQPK